MARCRRYEKLIPSHHRLMGSLLRAPVGTAGSVLIPCTDQEDDKKKQQAGRQLDTAPQHPRRHFSSFRPAQHHWNKIQFETFV